jgi:hypothetical protein
VFALAEYVLANLTVKRLDYLCHEVLEAQPQPLAGSFDPRLEPVTFTFVGAPACLHG